MSVNLEQLIVGLLFLVPGFISTAAEKTFQPRRFNTAYEWTSSSLVRSIGLNILGIIFIVLLSKLGLISSEVLPLKIQNIDEGIRQLPFYAVFFYIIGLYLFSAVWGSVIGIYPQLTLRALANKLKLTSLGRHHSVWRRIKDVQRPKERPYAWIKIHLHNEKILFGRLRHASAIIEQDKPIELFLKPVYEVHQDQIFQPTCMGQNSDGVYVRLRDADIVEFYFNAEKRPSAFEPKISSPND